MCWKRVEYPYLDVNDIQLNWQLIKDMRVTLKVTLCSVQDKLEHVLAQYAQVFHDGIGTLKCVNTGHLGVQMKSLVRSYIWWPRLDCQIEDLAKTFWVSQTGISHRSLAASPRRLCDSLSWQNVPGISGCIFKMARGISCQKCYTCTDWWTAPHFIVPHWLTRAVGQRWWYTFYLRGIPVTNGLAECFIPYLNPMEGECHWKISNFLLAYRTSAHAATGQSPATLFMGRSL